MERSAFVHGRKADDLVRYEISDELCDENALQVELKGVP